MKRFVLLAVLCLPPTLGGCAWAEWFTGQETRDVPAHSYLQPDGTFVFTDQVRARLEAESQGTEVLSAIYDKEAGVLKVIVESPAEEAAETAIEEFVKNPFSWGTLVAVLAGVGGVIVKRQKAKKKVDPQPVVVVKTVKKPKAPVK